MRERFSHFKSVFQILKRGCCSWVPAFTQAKFATLSFKIGAAIAHCASTSALAAIHGDVAHSCEMRYRKEKSQRKVEVRCSVHLCVP